MLGHFLKELHMLQEKPLMETESLAQHPSAACSSNDSEQGINQGDSFIVLRG